MLTTTLCAALNGLEAIPVKVEVNLSDGSLFFMVGLPTTPYAKAVRAYFQPSTTPATTFLGKKSRSIWLLPT